MTVRPVILSEFVPDPDSVAEDGEPVTRDMFDEIEAQRLIAMVEGGPTCMADVKMWKNELRDILKRVRDDEEDRHLEAH